MTDSKIIFLINNLSEGLEVEVKNWLGGLQSNDEKAILAKEIIALANQGGGYIFIGFEDEGDGHPETDPKIKDIHKKNKIKLKTSIKIKDIHTFTSMQTNKHHQFNDQA